MDQSVDLSTLDLDELLEGSLDFDSKIMDEYEASKVLRAIRISSKEIDRLNDYKKRLLAEVEQKIGGKIAKLQDANEARRELISLYLKENGQKKISFPDLGTAHFSTSAKYEYDDAAIKQWLSTDGANLKSAVIKLTETLDKAALKKAVEAGDLTVPGFKSWQETTFVLKLEK